MSKHKTIGVLALQGDFAKHIEMLKTLDVNTKEVRTPHDLDKCDGLIIPGGESTTMWRQMNFIGLRDKISTFAKEKPIFGTCAGIILMSKEISESDMAPFGILDIVVERNAFGRQADSFNTEIEIKIEKETHLQHAVFIRAPRIIKCEPTVKVLSEFKGEPVLVQQGKHLGATFHPELTKDATLHRHFVNTLTL